MPAVDLLMNNAGVAIGGSFLDTSLADWEWILGINVLGVVHGCHYFVPAMVRRGARRPRGERRVRGGLRRATAGWPPTPPRSSAWSGLSEALRHELAPHGIGVTCICPGIIDTPITRVGEAGGSRRRRRACASA